MSYAIVSMEGRVVNEPEFKTGKENREFCTFRFVVNQQLGAQENASFYNCTGNEAMSNRIKKAGLAKGRMIHVVGRQTIREYKDREGTTKTSVDIGILDWSYVGAKPKGEDQAPNQAKPNTGTMHEEEYIGDPDDLPL